MQIYLKLLNLITMKSFIKYFENEFEKDKFKNKLKYSKKLMIIKDSREDYFID